MNIWEFRGSGMTNMHGATGDIVLLGTTAPQLEEIFFDLTHKMNTDLGGSGGNLRTPSCCLGTSRCEYACYDTQALCHYMTMEYQVINVFSFIIPFSDKFEYRNNLVR